MNDPAFIDRLNLFGYYLCRIAVGYIWHSLIITIITLCVVMLVRKKRASDRYVIWMSAVTMMSLIACMPFAVAFVDSVRVSIPLLPRYLNPFLTLSIGGEDSIGSHFMAFVMRNTAPSAFFSSLVHFVAFRFWAVMVILLGLSYCVIWFRGYRRYRFLKQVLWQAKILNRGRVVEIFDRAAKAIRLERLYVVCAHDDIVAPFTVDEYHPGIRKVQTYIPFRTGRDLPVVVVPSRLIRNIDDNTLYEMALHELSHVRNYDAAIVRTLTYFRRLFFFNPFAYVISHYIGDLIEESADDDVIDATGQPLDYARMLYRMAAESTGYPHIIAGSAALFVTRHSLLRRIKRILDFGGKKARLNRYAGTFLTASAIALSLWFIFLFPVSESWDHMTISGTAVVDGRVLAQCPVYVLWSDPSYLHKIAMTDDTGYFSCTVPDRNVSRWLLDPPRFYVFNNNIFPFSKTIPKYTMQNCSAAIELDQSTMGYSR